MFQNYTHYNSKFSVSRRNAYYHSYKNLPTVTHLWCIVTGMGLHLDSMRSNAMALNVMEGDDEFLLPDVSDD